MSKFKLFLPVVLAVSSAHANMWDDWSAWNARNRRALWEDIFGKSKNDTSIEETPEQVARRIEDAATGQGFDAIIGVPDELRQVADMINHPQRYRDLGISVPKGILMYGPPGTGKTALARALAAEIPGAQFISRSGSSFVALYVGAGPLAVRELFAEAENLLKYGAKAVIIMVDEIDALGSRNSDNSSGSSEYNNTVNEFLTKMDGIDKTYAGRIFVVGTTNRLENLDKAFRRPGRFDYLVPVMAPNAEARAAILDLYLARTKNEVTAEARAEAVKATGGWTGAEIEALVREAGMRAANAYASCITDEHLKTALAKCTSMRRLRN